MSKAKEIASERYARGEISKQEFEDISSTLGSPIASETQPSAPPPLAKSGANEGISIVNLLLGAVCVAGLILGFWANNIVQNWGTFKSSYSQNEMEMLVGISGIAFVASAVCAFLLFRRLRK